MIDFSSGIWLTWTVDVRGISYLMLVRTMLWALTDLEYLFLVSNYFRSRGPRSGMSQSLTLLMTSLAQHLASVPRAGIGLASGVAMAHPVSR